MSPPALRRRAVLGGAVVAVSLSGCDLVTSDPDPEAPSRTPAPDRTSTSPDPDSTLVEDVRTDIAEALALVVAALGARPGLRAELGDLPRLHRRHLDALEGEVAAAARPRVTGPAARVRARVRAEEERLRVRLADAAVGSASGPLAALFASMSAAVAQQLARQPETERR